MSDKRTTYVYGNAVRQFEPVPKPTRPEKERRENPERNRKPQQTKADRRALRNRERAMRMSRSYVAFLTVAVMITCVVCCCYIFMQSQVSSHLTTISSLETQVESLKTENDETLRRVESTINLSDIKKKAMKDLGMTYPTEDQVVYYDVDNSDYMVQYSDIPDSSDSILSIFGSK